MAYGDGQILGNCGVEVDRWHWTGRGAGSTTVPPGQPLTRRLEAGPFTFRVYAREGPGNPHENPRLDQKITWTNWRRGRGKTGRYNLRLFACGRFP